MAAIQSGCAMFHGVRGERRKQLQFAQPRRCERAGKYVRFLETLVKNALEDLDKINANPRPCPGDEAALLCKGSFEHWNP
jgi:hypothetical protein